jgi:hypothetical protein
VENPTERRALVTRRHLCRVAILPQGMGVMPGSVWLCLIGADVQHQGEADLFPGKGVSFGRASGKRPDPSACDRRPTG